MAGRGAFRTMLLAVALAGGAAPALALPADFKARADAYVNVAWPANGPGASVIVVENGKTVYARGRGLADIAAKTPITPDTVFRLGSITKQFSAAVILQLVDEGRLSLDDPLSKFLPAYPQPGASATVRQLLNHTVGVQPYTDIPGWMVEANINRPYTTHQLIAVFKDMPVVSQPGQVQAYNNSGYVLVGAVIERVTRKPWHQAVEERIGWFRLPTIRYGLGEAGMPNMAKGYTLGLNGQEPARQFHMSFAHAAGALIGNSADLARWAQALHHGKMVSGPSYAQMIAPTKLPGGKVEPYGLGLGLVKIGGVDAIGHGGKIFGFLADSLYIPSKDTFVAVLVNSDVPATAPSVAVGYLSALALGKPLPTGSRVDWASLEPLFGVYRAGPGGDGHSFYARDGQLYTRHTRHGDRSEAKVIAAGNDLFFYGPHSLTWFAIRREASGAHVMEMHRDLSEDPERTVRVGPVPDPSRFSVARPTLERYVGAYAFGQGTATVAWAGRNGLTIQLSGQPSFTLRPVSATEFRAEIVGARVVFHGGAGRAERLVIDQGGRQIEAKRVPPR